MENGIDTLGDARIFTIIDEFNGYWQVDVAKENYGKKSFVCHDEQFQCGRMLFGLKKAPETFQWGFDVIIFRFKWKTWPVYNDDIIIIAKYVKEQIYRVDEILTALQNTGVP